MKKLISYFLYTSMFMVLISLGACQEEFEDLPEQNNQEAIKASSSTAQLIKRASSKDGSYDNIVDGASCFAINFPYVVHINGLEVKMNTKKDLELIEDLLDEFDDDLNIIFPVTITLSDYSEIAITDEDQLEDLVEACLVDDDDDDDIECVNFVYPFTVYSFDINLQQTGSVSVENDMQLRRYFNNLDDDDLISFQFPISLKLYNDIKVVVNNNAEMVNIIEKAKDDCDDDDDDDDFSQEELKKFLVACPLLMKEVISNGESSTIQYLENLMSFEADGTATVKDSVGNTVIGSWSTVKVGSKVKLKLIFNDLVDISLEWFVYDIGDGRIKLIANDGNKIILKKACDIVNNKPEVLREILKECSWVISKVEIDDEELDRLLGYEFSFMADGGVTLSNGDIFNEGTWEVTSNPQGRLIMAIEMGGEPGVSFKWLLSELKDKGLKFSMEDDDYELVLERACDNNNTDGDVVEIRNILKEGEWVIAKYLDDDEDETAAYANLDFTFSANAVVSVSTNTVPVHLGIWKIIRNSDNQLKCYLNFGSVDSLEELTDDWKIVSVSDKRLELKDKDDDGSMDVLVFERK